MRGGGDMRGGGATLCKEGIFCLYQRQEGTNELNRIAREHTQEMTIRARLQWRGAVVVVHVVQTRHRRPLPLLRRFVLLSPSLDTCHSLE
jgi:hypothetical protein